MEIVQALQLAVSHHHAGRLAEAEAIYRQVLAQQPDNVDALRLLGILACRTGHIDAGLTLLRRAHQLAPQAPLVRRALAEALSQHAEVVRLDGRLPEALNAATEAVQLRPDLPHAHNNLGNALLALGRPADAKQAYAEAVRLDPKFAEAMCNLATVLRDYGQFAESLQLYRAAIALKPDASELHNNYGTALRDAGEVESALEEYRTTIRLNPRFWPAWSNLLFNMNFIAALSGQEILQEHLRWANKVAREGIAPQSPSPPREPIQNRRLRIGYVSADFRDHPVGRFMLPLLTNHDRARFEIFCYGDVVRADHVTEQIRALAGTFRQTLALSDDRLCEQIRADRIDVLVDLTVHCAWNRLLVFARKPAPVQATYLSYPGTTGLAAVDFRLTDRFLDPPNEPRPFYSEQSIYLQSTYWCYCEVINAPQVGPLPIASNGFVTFGCLNSFAKVSTPALAAWARLLARIPRSRLILHAAAGPHRDRAMEEFRRHGIADDRVEFVPRMDVEPYFATFNRIDIALDPFPVPGGTTTCDGLWMGVPAVTLAGDSAARRGGVSLLSLIDLADFVTDNVDRYIDVAAALAGDPERLAELRGTLRQRMRASPIMNGKNFARDVERCYLEMWNRAP